MYGKLIMNDIRKSKLVSITTAAFIVASAALTSAAARWHESVRIG